MSFSGHLVTVGVFDLRGLFVSLVLCLVVLVLRSGVALVFRFRCGFGLGGFVLGFGAGRVLPGFPVVALCWCCVLCGLGNMGFLWFAYGFWRDGFGGWYGLLCFGGLFRGTLGFALLRFGGWLVVSRR